MCKNSQLNCHSEPVISYAVDSVYTNWEVELCLLSFIAGHLQGHLINFYDLSTIFGNKSSNINFLLNGHIYREKIQPSLQVLIGWSRSTQI